MTNYHHIEQSVKQLAAVADHSTFVHRISRMLVDSWLHDYDCTSPDGEIVGTTTSDFTYLFDLTEERLIAAFGVSRGAIHTARDKSRMAGHPLSAGRGYHRGHAIPHSLGGPTDINLVPQLGKINIGPFRKLEIEATKSPGSLYFTHWVYHKNNGQTPSSVNQGLVHYAPEPGLKLRRHGN
jgi:hypothetical protein